MIEPCQIKAYCFAYSTASQMMLVKCTAFLMRKTCRSPSCDAAFSCVGWWGVWEAAGSREERCCLLTGWKNRLFLFIEEKIQKVRRMCWHGPPFSIHPFSRDERGQNTLGSLAQLVEQLTLNQLVRCSSHRWPTSKKEYPDRFSCRDFLRSFAGRQRGERGRDAPALCSF